MFVMPDTASSQEAGNTPEQAPQPTADVIWQSGNFAQSRIVPAARVGDRFICVRPADSPRAKPEILEYQKQEFAIELLANSGRPFERISERVRETNRMKWLGSSRYGSETQAIL